MAKHFVQSAQHPMFEDTSHSKDPTDNKYRFITLTNYCCLIHFDTPSCLVFIHFNTTVIRLNGLNLLSTSEIACNIQDTAFVSI